MARRSKTQAQIQKVALEYEAYVNALARAANVPTEEARAIAARLTREGFIWEKVKP